MNEESLNTLGECDVDRATEALLSLIERTGYNMVQENGQRKFGGPPPDWDGPPPPRGCEIFIGKIPRDMFEDELIPVFERAGRIYEFRLMMEFSGDNRGYAFIMYTTKEAAQRAIQLLDNFEIRPGKFIGVCVSIDNCRLFVGSIPREKTKEEILEEMRKVTDGVVDVIVYQSVVDKTRNRGFAFVEYESHKAAAMARRKLLAGSFQLWGQTIRVHWAEPERDVDEETMLRVRVLFVRNLMLSTTEDTIKSEFSRFKPGAVERVKKLSDYAFVHFFSREDAVAARHAMNGRSIDGSAIEVTLAKPIGKDGSRRFNQRGPMGPSGDSFFVQGKDEQCSVSPSKSLSLLARHSSPCIPDVQRCMYPFYQETNVIPISVWSLKPNQFCSAVTLLEYYCNKNNWSLPEYYLYCTTGQDGKLLLIFKVVITSVQSSFMPDKMCTILEDARELAAQNALWNLDFLVHVPGSPAGITLASGLMSCECRGFHYPGYLLSSFLPMTSGTGHRLYLSNQSDFY